ncbi:MAG: PCMD domain-containing protein, partial [Candidatus Cryptobacteroides sp.]
EASASTVSALNAIGFVFSPIYKGDKQAKIDITGYVANLASGTTDLGFTVIDNKGSLEDYSWTLNVLSDTEADPIAAYPSVTSASVSAKWFAAERPAGLGIEYKMTSESSWTKAPASALTFDDAAKTVTANLTGLVPGTEYAFRPYTDNDTAIRSINFTTTFAVKAVSAKPWAKFAVVTGKWLTDSRPSGLSFKYRKKGTSAWTAADPSTVVYNNTSKTFTGEIRGLSSSSSYEFCATSDLDADANNQSVSFTTAGAPTLYNMSFDDWYQSGKIWYPYAQGASPSVWDSANPGAANFIGSSTTPEETTVAVSGTGKKAARLESKWAVIAFAAGNVYTGKFGKINGKGAILDWGVEFTGRPVALKGYYNYTPKTIDKTESPYESMAGTMDKCQFQVILTDWSGPFTINTTSGTFVDLDNDPSIIAYSKFESDVATDGYAELTIPITYRDTSRTPTYIVITCCASYLGDYFTGGVGSLLYVDELSFEYDLDALTKDQASKVNYR